MKYFIAITIISIATLLLQNGVANAQASLDNIELNSGKRWEMDENTRYMFAKMTASFVNEDYEALGKNGLQKAGAELQKNIDELIKKCTMDGGAHDQLHAYLEKYIPAVKELAKSGAVEAAQDVKYYLDNYDSYFE